MLPGPVTRSTRRHGPAPYANIAIAWAPPTAYTSSMPSSAQAARIVGCGRPRVNVLLRRARQRDRADAGDLGGYDVHQHAGDQRRDAARDVEADPVDRHQPLRDPRAGAEVGDRVGLQLGRAGDPQPADRLLETRPDSGVQGRERLAERLPGTAMSVCVDAVEPLGVLRDRLDPAVAHVVADRSHDMQRGLDVEVGARHQGAVVGGGTGPSLAAAAPEVDPANHAAKSRRGGSPARTTAQRPDSAPRAPLITRARGCSPARSLEPAPLD